MMVTVNIHGIALFPAASLASYCIVYGNGCSLKYVDGAGPVRNRLTTVSKLSTAVGIDQVTKALFDP